MKPRTPEAARLEADYLARVRQTLGSRRGAAEIAQSVAEHIEEAVAEFKDLEVSLVQMAQVVERLGAPESYADGGPGQPGAAGELSADARRRVASLLDKVWMASLITTVGLFVPFIDFYVCTLIGYGMLAVVLRNRDGLPEEFRTLSRFSKIIAVAAVLNVPLAVAGFFEPKAAFLTLPTEALLVVLPLVVSWRLLGGIASFLRTARQDALASATLDARRIFITLEILLTAIAVVVGAVIAVARMGGSGRHHEVSSELNVAAAGLAMLPLNWVLSSFFLLRPISRARQALAEPSVAPGVGLAPDHGS